MESTNDGAAVETRPDLQTGDLLSLDEAAHFLGTSTTTVYRLLKQNDLNGLKVGRQWRFRKSDLLAHLERSQRPADTLTSEGVAGEIDFFYSDPAVRNALPTVAAEAETEIKRLAYGILGFAINAGASDIHLEPEQQADEPYLLMRMRVNGTLREVRRMPISLHPPLLKTFTKMAGIDAAKTNQPVFGRLDGRIYLSCRPSWRNGEGRFEIPVSCLPTTRGEDLTMRLYLPPAAVVNGLDHIEIADEQRSQIRGWLRHRHGLIAGTGLGQQKQFLYNCLLEVASPERKTIVLEESQDCSLPLAASVPVNRQTGVTVADALRAVHNHDPDVIMVETTGDAETAQLIHELAFTEYLVLTAVPANTSARAVHWFLHQHVEPLVVARTLLGVVAQWQARRICPYCKEPVDLSVSDPIFLRVQQIAANGGYEIPSDATFYHGRGCEQCRNRGYRGRVELFEVMTWNNALTEALLQGAAVEDLTQVAVGQGMRTMLADGISKAIEGKTTLDEVLLAGMATI